MNSEIEHIRAFLEHPKRKQMIKVVGVEKVAGVSKSTLEKFLRGVQGISEENLPRIVKSLQLIGYKPLKKT